VSRLILDERYDVFALPSRPPERLVGMRSADEHQIRLASGEVIDVFRGAPSGLIYARTYSAATGKVRWMELRKRKVQPAKEGTHDENGDV